MDNERLSRGDFIYADGKWFPLSQAEEKDQLVANIYNGPGVPPEDFQNACQPRWTQYISPDLDKYINRLKQNYAKLEQSR